MIIMFTVEDYKLMNDLAKMAVEKLDEELLERILLTKGKIGVEVARNPEENDKLIVYLDEELKNRR